MVAYLREVVAKGGSTVVTEISLTEVDERSSDEFAVNENSEGERNFILSCKTCIGTHMRHNIEKFEIRT